MSKNKEPKLHTLKSAVMQRIIFLVLLLITSSNLLPAQNIEEVRITEFFREQPMREFLEILRQKYQVNVFYKESWVAPYTISKTFVDTPLEEALSDVFDNSELSYTLFQNDAIAVFRRVMDTRSRFDEFSQTLVIGDPINIGRYKTATLKGRVLDGKTEDPLMGAVVYNNKLQRGASSNIEGKFQLEMPTGDHDLQISFVGFQSSTRKIRLIEDGTADFPIFEESLNIGEVTVVGEQSSLPRSQMSMAQMTALEIRQMPALMGEVDVLKGLTIIAGVQTVSELAAGFNVRGGNTDQNLILVNGSPLFNSSHLFGFLSLINPDLVEDVRLFKGGVPTKYGERVSSVMDIGFKEGNNETIRLRGGIGIINSRLTLEGPLSKNKKLTFIAGGRSSYTNWIFKEIPDVDINQSVTNFYDAAAKITYKFNAHNKMSAMAYVSDDEFSTSKESVTKYGSILGNMNVHSRFAENLYGELQLAFSDYRYRLSDFAGQTPQAAYQLSNALQYASGAYNFRWHVSPRHAVEAGFKGIYNRIEPGEISALNAETLIENRTLNREKLVEWAVYAGDEFTVLPQFSISAGLRYTHFSNLGTPVVYLYSPEQTMTPETVIDSMTYTGNQASASYHGLEPRISLNYDLNPGTSLKMSYQRIRQHVFQISNNAVISPAETWKAADYHLKPIISDQFALGVGNNTLLQNYSLTAEIYYKNLQNLIEYKNGAQLIMNPQIETALIPTRGYSYGIELSAAKKMGRLTGYASYTFSRTMQKNISRFEQENLWNGNYYRSMYDRPHDVSLTTTYNISRRWKFSANFVAVSGRPVTLPELEYDFGQEQLVYFSERNKYRMPAYHRMDLSITLDQNLKKKRSWKGSWTFAVYNVYGRHNPYSVYYKKTVPGQFNNYSNYALFKLSVIGVPIPSLTYNFVF